MSNLRTTSHSNLTWLLIILGVSWLVQWLWGIPWLWLAPVIIIFILDRPLTYLMGVIIIGEVITTMHPGMVTLVILAPWLIWKVRQPQIDLSIIFWLWIAGLVGSQVIIYFLPEIVAAAAWLPNYQGAKENITASVPWPQLLRSAILSIIVSYLAIILIHFNRRYS